MKGDTLLSYRYFSLTLHQILNSKRDVYVLFCSLIGVIKSLKTTSTMLLVKPRVKRRLKS